MCGITGTFGFQGDADPRSRYLEDAIRTIRDRGPDDKGTLSVRSATLGHARLSVIDPSESGHQPMVDGSGRYSIVFNGEIYNYKEKRKELRDDGVTFTSTSDTEVLLELFRKKGKACLEELNGFFALGIHDKEKDELFLARDRYGIKPLYYYRDAQGFLFGSALSTILSYDIPKEVDMTALEAYLQLTYVPAPLSMIKGVRKLLPGRWMKIGREGVEEGRIPIDVSQDIPNEKDDPVGMIRQLLEDSVRVRMRSDVPLGGFLSGGVDSSVVALLAKKQDPSFQTFSIGYEDERFDESKFSRMVADHIGSEHTVFRMGKDDLEGAMSEVLEGMDEPFADSSAIPVHYLCGKTREQVTVALSGDGADELFAGYNKHFGEYKVREPGFAGVLARKGSWLWKGLPGNRTGRVGNLIRKLERYAKGANMSLTERYWAWACFNDPSMVNNWLGDDHATDHLEGLKKEWLKTLDPEDRGLNSFLDTDLAFVLPNDMLTKVDRMSMNHGLEVRVPFLDHRFVEYVRRLPSEQKINGYGRKRVLKASFEDDLPSELFQRGKQGFEVPLVDLLRNRARDDLQELFDPDLLRSQGIFDADQVKGSIDELFKKDPGDNGSRVWTLLVFQKWWKKTFS